MFTVGWRTKEWKGLLKLRGFRWCAPRRCWIQDRLDEESAVFIQKELQETVGNAFNLYIGRGLFVEPRWDSARQLYRDMDPFGRSTRSPDQDV